MELYNVGVDEPYDLNYRIEDCFVWVVYDYEDGCYDGNGTAVGLNKDDGMLYVKNLGHCSCYGPMEGGMLSGDKYTVEQFLAHKDNVLHYDAGDNIKTKVAELTNLSA